MFSGYEILYRPPLRLQRANLVQGQSGGIAVYLLTVTTRGKGGKTAFMRMSSNGKDISLPSWGRGFDSHHSLQRKDPRLFQDIQNECNEVAGGLFYFLRGR